MYTFVAIAFVSNLAIYIVLQLLLHLTQDRREPRLLESTVPFFDSAIGILKHRANYLRSLRSQYQINIHTLRLPFQRLYVVHAPHLIHIIQSKANASAFVPNLLEFGMLFSGLNKDSQRILTKAFGLQGNAFTMSVHKYLLSGPSLRIATSTAVDKLSASLQYSFAGSNGGLLGLVRHELTLAMTGAIYGPENPYDDLNIEESWYDFVPGIGHLLYSPFPKLTARKALQARGRVISGFRKYFETGGHLQAFPMISEMYEANKSHGLSSGEAAKMEMATSLAMLSSGSNTAFWLLYQVFSDACALQDIRNELTELSTEKSSASDNSRCRILSLDLIRTKCPTLNAMLDETLRFHSSVINIKQVQHDTTLAEQYLLKKDAIIMIPGQSVHHEKEIWGPNADVFDHLRILGPESKRKLSSTSSFRPFGAGATMCPGRHFSTNVILSLVAMVVLKYDIVPVQGRWRAPTKRNADIWNAMPKPDWDLDVKIIKHVSKTEVEWKFVWADKVESV